jgi:ketosteroid isomerase-like protein
MDMKIEAQEGLAVATCAFTYEAAFANGRVSKGKATETLVLAKEGGQWRIRHIHWSSRAIKSVKP